jgi:APA family basic amino acid/polyamine antiporter
VLRRDAVEHHHFRAPTVFPILALVTCVALLTQQSAATWLRAALLLAVGVVLYAVSRRRSTRTDAESPRAQ